MRRRIKKTRALPIGRQTLKKPTKDELKLLKTYVLGKERGMDIAENYGLSRQRICQIIQSIAYRKYYFDLKGKNEITQSI